MTKKQLKEKNNKNRSIFYQWNLGTRDMKSAKDYNRKNKKKDIEKEIKSYD